MLESDVFERRLASALVGYAAEVSGAVDAADVAHRVALEHPHRRARLLGWRPAATLRAAWLLLLLAALLAAAVAGALVGGWRPNAEPWAINPPVACPWGSAPDEPGPAEQARPRLEPYSIGVAFDRSAGKLVAQTRSSGDDAFETWTFDVCSNTWARMAPAQQPPTRQLHLVYDTDSDLTIGVATAGTWAYDLDTDTWTERTAPPIGGAFRVVYEPVSGRVLVWSLDRSPTQWWAYDVDTDTWTEIPQRGENVPPRYESDDHQLIAYDSAVERVIVYQPGTSLFDPNNGTWSTSSGSTPGVSTAYWASGNEIAFDEATSRTVVFSDGLVIAFDATASTWEVLWDSTNGLGGYSDTTFRCCGTGPQARLGHSMVYDPLNKRIVVLGGTYRGDGGWVENPDDVWAFEPSTTDFRMLVPPITP